MKDNPYQTPESDLTTEEAQLPKTLWWKIFFFLNAILMLLVIVSIVFLDEMTFGLWESIDMATSLIVTVSLFGLAFNKTIGKQVFWQYFFYAYLVLSIAFFLLFPVLGIDLYGQTQEFDGAFAIGLVFGFLYVWASYVYAYKRNQLWNIPSD